jgi:hypothetical protein
MVYRRSKKQIPPLRCGMTTRKASANAKCIAATLYTFGDFALGQTSIALAPYGHGDRMAVRP